jgi:O-antigen ligase
VAKIARQQPEVMNSLGLNINLRYFVWVGAIPMVFYPPFMRGLFFPPEWLMAQFLIGMVLIVYGTDLLVKNEPLPVKAPMSLTLGGLTIAYLVSLLAAVNINQGVTGFIQVLSYFGFYLVILTLIKSKQDMDRVMITIFLSGLGVALIGMAAAVGVLDYPGAFAGRRINSTFQYPNTLAIYMLVTWLIGLYLWSNTSRVLMKVLCGTGTFLAVVVLMGTQSRGVYLIVPLALILWLAGLPKEKFWEGVYYTIFVTGTSLMIGRMLIPALLAQSGSLALQWVVVGAVITLVGAILFHLGPAMLAKFDVREKYRQLLAVGGVLYFLLMGFLYYSYAVKVVPDISRQLAPTHVVTRVETINMDDSSLVAREVFNQDAWLIIKDNLWLGTGAGGWENLYHRYKSYNYFSTEVHNHFYQVWVEAGVFGFIFFTGAFVILLFLVLKKWPQRGAMGHWPALWTVLIAALALGSHSFMDFNLSLPAVALTLWTLLALGQGGAALKEAGPLKKNTALIPQDGLRLPGRLGQWLIIWVVAIFLTVNGYNFYKAGHLGAEGAKAMKANEYYRAVKLMEQAHRLNPLAASYAVDLAQIYMKSAVDAENIIYANQAREYAEKARRLEPYNHRMRGALAATHFYMGDLSLYAGETKAIRDIMPMETASWENYGAALLLAARFYHERGEGNTGDELARQAFSLYQEAREYQEGLSERERRRQQPFTVSEQLYLVKGQAAYLLGEYLLAQEILEEVSRHKNLKIAAETWLAATLLQLGDQEASEELTRHFDPELSAEIEQLIELKYRGGTR